MGAFFPPTRLIHIDDPEDDEDDEDDDQFATYIDQHSQEAA
jgi:hypothetical protein